MNIHDRRGELICSYIDGLLKGRAKEKFEKEMMKSPELAAQCKEMTIAARACKDLPEAELPPDFAKRLHQRLLTEVDTGEDTKRSKKWFADNKWAGLASATAACFVLVLILRLAVTGGIPQNATRSGISDEQADFGITNAEMAAADDSQDGSVPTLAGDTQGKAAGFTGNSLARQVNAQIKVSDVSEAQSEIMQFATENGFTNHESIGCGEAGTESRTASVILVKIPFSQFDGFFAWIADKFPEALIVSDLNTDMTEEIIDARNRLVKLDSVIKEVEAEEPRDTERIESLYYERSGIVDELSILNQSVENITLTVVLQSKEQ